MIRAWLVSVLCTSLMLCGCGGMTFRIPVDPGTEDLSAPVRAPLHAGVYYSPQFSSQELTRTWSMHTYVAEIGAGSVKLFDALMPRVFEKTSALSRISPDELAAKGIDLVVAPSLEHFDFRVGMVGDSDRYSVAYRVTLYTSQGVPTASWIVPGNAVTRTHATLSPSAALAGTINDDLRDAAAKFLNDFQSHAAPTLALAQSGRSAPATLDPRQFKLTAKQGNLPGIDPQKAGVLRDAGIMPIEVAGESFAARDLLMRGSDMRLRLKDGRLIEPEPISSVLSSLETTRQSHAALLIGGPLLAFAADASLHREAQAEREKQMGAAAEVLFLERRLAAGKPQSGLVLFRIPRGVKGEEVASLSAWIVDPARGEGQQVEINLLAEP